MKRDIPDVVKVTFRPRWRHVFQLIWFGLTEGKVTIVIPGATITNYETHTL